eukprot:gene60433-82687_t
MINSIIKGISKIFGDKSEKDIKEMKPLVDEINRYFEQYKGLSNDELRGKTIEFKNRIADFLKEIDAEIAELRYRTEGGELNIEETEGIFNEIDKLKKKRDEELEKVLKQILPEAFAVVKETARRYTENAELEVTATDNDRDLAARKGNVRIEGNK